MIDKGRNSAGWPIGLTREEAAEFSGKIRDDLKDWLSEVRHYPAERETIENAIKILDEYSRPEKH